MSAAVPPRLYLVSPPRLDAAAFADPLARALGAGDVGCFQLWLPDADEDLTRRAAERLMPVAHRHEVAFLINDRPALARAIGADGVHLTAENAGVAAARRTLGDDLSLGVSCFGSRHRAMEAGELGADYVSFGPFFTSPTKPDAPAIEPDILTWWAELFELPCVAIGGVTAANAGGLARAGADFVAAVSWVWDHPDGPAAAVRRLNDALKTA